MWEIIGDTRNSRQISKSRKQGSREQQSKGDHLTEKNIWHYRQDNVEI